MKRYLPFIIILLVGLAAFASGNAIFRKQKAILAAVETADAGAAKPGAKPPHIRGDPTAPVTLEEFGDFQCPPCGIFSAALLKLEHDYGTRLRVIFREFPLDMHAHAKQAALAAEAAGMQGRFWEMHDALYHNQATWAAATDPTAIFAQYAGALGLDQARFGKDLADQETAERIEDDQARANSLDVTSTPTIFVNHHRVPVNSMNDQALRKLIDEALNQPAPAAAK